MSRRSQAFAGFNSFDQTRQNLGKDFQFKSDQNALDSILNNEGVNRRSLNVNPSSAKPAAAPLRLLAPSIQEFETKMTSDKVEALESANGDVFLRRMKTVTRSPLSFSANRKLGGRTFPVEMQARRMKLAVSPPQSSTAPLHPKEPFTRDNNARNSTKKAKTYFNPKAGQPRQSFSEPKAPPLATRPVGRVPVPKQVSSQLPVPSSRLAKKSLVFAKPDPPKSIITKPEKKPISIIKPPIPSGKKCEQVTKMRPAVPTTTKWNLMPPPAAPLQTSSEAQFPRLEFRDSFMQTTLRRLTVDALAGGLPLPRDSLAWVAQLPRNSLAFSDLLQMMSAEEARATQDDDTCSFEAMENRLRTPKRPQNSRREARREQGKENREPSRLEVESVERSLSQSDKNVDEVGGFVRSISRSTSMSELATGEAHWDGVGAEKGLPLKKCTSMLSLPGETGEEEGLVSLSDLVPAGQVCHAVEDLASCLQELEVYRGQQEQLLRQNHLLLEKIKERETRFKQLWGVSPLKIATKKTAPSAGGVSGVITPTRESATEVQVPVETERKVRFNSGMNSTLAFTPATPTEDGLLSPLATSINMNASSANLQSLKSDLSFLQTPLHANRGGGDTSASRTPASCRSQRLDTTTTPGAIKSLKNRVETAFAVLYADED